jgi:phosphate transport system permease protein
MHQFFCCKPRTGRFWRQGEPFVWATGAALAMTLTLTFALLAVVLWNSLGVFWPAPVAEIHLADGSKLLGEELQSEINRETGSESVKFKVGNMEDGPAFRWIDKKSIREVTYPKEAFVLERLTNMNRYGLFHKLETPGLELSEKGAATERLSAALKEVRQKHHEEIAPLNAQLSALAKEVKDHLKYAILRLSEIGAIEEKLQSLRAKETELKRESDDIVTKMSRLENELAQNVVVLTDAEGREKSIALTNIVRFTDPNQMGVLAKIGHYLAKIWDLVSTDPRESNQDGGLFPAIFGTVLMVFFMAFSCFPLGIVAGIYLGEYAKEGWMVRLVRIAVNNLAGIPSIVYGIFGLGFFIYLIGGNLDRLMYPERIAAGEPVFGQGCILWASLTLGLLTIPVVIVSTEEALRAIPRGIRESSYALGSTKLQLLWRVLIPMASPGMMTGFILAMARAAGEVAPLMLTGAVKNAPVPFDSSFPFLHPDRQFMHLGFHILDISCKSPNVEATKPMVYVTTLLLLLIVLTMSSVAIYLRNKMRKKYLIKSL